ncbi:type 1 glutamine amidotransferase [Salipiger sp. 1_MG-2023]|uniref:gamma-glutamyl-gamma-aminobutyrate hydrolase family protein n=1 Tax=Salipiger sp. 1_MG-2023 TaxID=3062665 RepID=UPI0026E387A6|nr:type 1 glutamine amidotransferase [Salipiger sp. 1_MG-2023]MDO6586471.1 type 1 glutamine amidotransferase [Salipiger sp. 1_MG-2023]
MTSRPLIGVTVSRKSGWRVFPLMKLAIWLAGGRALRWQAGYRTVDLDAVDGVVIGGGDDIAPTLYGGELRVDVRLDPARDALEQSVLRGAFDRGLPILGICRGSQMLNVVLGGTLHQDAYEVYQGSRYVRTVLPRKRVLIEGESLLSRSAKASCIYVNALHSQAVDVLGQGLRVAARDEGGMVQAIERMSDPFALGVQWHPEHLVYRRAHRRLFRSLVAAARAERSAGGDAQLDAARQEAREDDARRERLWG